MRKYLTDLQTQQMEARIRAITKTIERKGAKLQEIKRKSPRTVD